MDSNYFFSSKAMNIPMMVLSKGLVNWPCGCSPGAFIPAVTDNDYRVKSVNCSLS